MGSLSTHRKGSVVTVSSDTEDWVDVLGFGGASGDQPYPELTVEELERERAARRAALDRKRPCGFAAWSD